MKRLFRVKYPKIIAIILVIVISYLIFKSEAVQDYVVNMGDLSYLGVFLAGMLFAFGFSAPLAAGFFIILSPENIYLAALSAGAGAMLGDLLIFHIIRISFKGELEKLKNEKLIKEFDGWLEKDFGKTLTHYLIYAFAGLLIASPLPDEFGMIMMAGLTKIKAPILAIVCFVLHTIGLYILFSI